jgi:hypothetical protein
MYMHIHTGDDETEEGGGKESEFVDVSKKSRLVLFRTKSNFTTFSPPFLPSLILVPMDVPLTPIQT